jgi:hypothetical protein
MTHSDEPSRLRAEAGAESELLRSASEDAPSSSFRQQAMSNVLASHRAERRAQSRLRWGAACAALGVAACLALVLRRPTRTPNLSLEPQPEPSHGAELTTPKPLASSVPTGPLAPCTPAVTAGGSEPLLDDFEDGDTRIPLLEKRAGTWVVFNDGTGSQIPKPGANFVPERIPGGRGASRFGLHAKGGKFTKWGAVLSTDLSPRRCYDASAYAGIEFWARGRGFFRLGVQMTQVVAEEYGGSCVDKCFDGHFAQLGLDKAWQRYRVRWEDLAQRGIGQAVPFDPHSLIAIQFAVPPEQTPFEFWIDDVAFLPRGRD